MAGIELMAALFLSPHLDDAVFSAGGLIATLTRSGVPVTVATVFTRSVPNPKGFALACQLDKGFPAQVDYMALRREEDALACARLGARPLWLDLPEAPHRGYHSAAELFADRREDDPTDPVIAAIRPLVETAEIVFVPEAVGDHVDHHLVRDAAATLAGERALLWLDQPYAQKVGIRRGGTVALAEEDLARKLAACAAYTSQIPFQFGGVGAMRETLTAAARRGDAKGDASLMESFGAVFASGNASAILSPFLAERAGW